uniref:Periplasmic chaperone PpiD n=1 Tax=Desulfobacca acetoxidans TaxID=60893 RepID=A0A7C3ZA41_9BACT
MLKILRKHSKHWVIGLVIGAIVVVFIFWGMGRMHSSHSQELARVYGEPIPLTTFYQYAALLEKKARFRRSLTDEDYKALRQQAPDSLIRLVLLNEEAKRLGLTVSDAEVQAAIIRDPDFQNQGAFDPRLYDFFIGQGRRREAEKVTYEKWLRLQILAAKTVELITSFAKVSEAELQEFFRLAREAVLVDYLVVSPEPFIARVKPTDAELKEYYQKHEAEFRVPEKVKVSYVLLRPEDFRKQVQITPEEIENYQKEHDSELVRPATIRGREIVLPMPPKGDADTRQQLKKKAEDLLRQARQGQDFAQLARTFSKDEAHRLQGGDLGPVTRGKKGEAWDKVAFALEPGQVGLAQTADGFHIIKLEEILKTEPLPEAEAKAWAAEKLKELKSRQLAHEEAKNLQAETATAPFQEAARKRKLAPLETPLFSLAEPIPGLGAVKAFNQEAFSLKAKEVGLAEVPEGFAVMQAMARQPAALLSFEEAKDKVRQAVARQEAQKMAEKEAGQLLARLRQGEALAKVAAQNALPVKDSGYFSRVQGFLQQPLAESLTSAAFQLSEKNPYPPRPIFWQGKYYLLAFKGRRAPDQEEFQKERENLERRILQDKRQVLLEAWFREEWRRAKVSKPKQQS